MEKAAAAAKEQFILDELADEQSEGERQAIMRQCSAENLALAAPSPKSSSSSSSLIILALATSTTRSTVKVTSVEEPDDDIPLPPRRSTPTTRDLLQAGRPSTTRAILNGPKSSFIGPKALRVGPKALPFPP